MNKRVDHAEASSRFIASKDHIAFHDQRLWDLRQKRDRESEEIPEWEELRSLASAIKEHTLTHLADYLERFEQNAIKNGARVHWARDAAEHNQIVLDILARAGRNAREEQVYAHRRVRDGPLPREPGHRDHRDRPRRTHPAARPGARRATSSCPRCTSSGRTWRGCSGGRSAPIRRTATCPISPRASARTRGLYLTAEAGMTGANFAVAETGSFVVCTNEGNADLSVIVPKLHVASIGIEKIIPRVEDLGVFVRLLSRSALGSPITQITSHFRAPRDGRRCTSSWSTTAVPSAWAWPTSGTRSNASAAAPA